MDITQINAALAVVEYLSFSKAVVALRRRFAVSSGLSTRLRIKKYSISHTAISNSIIKGGSAFETICFV